MRVNDQSTKLPNIAAIAIDRVHVQYRCPYCQQQHNDFLENKRKPIPTGCGEGKIRFSVLPKVDVFRTYGDVTFRILDSYGQALVTPQHRIISVNDLNAYFRRQRAIAKLA